MRKVREILRLTYDAGLPSREVGRQAGVGSTGVRVMLQRFRASKLEWPLPEGLTDTALEAKLYGVAATRGGQHSQSAVIVDAPLLHAAQAASLQPSPPGLQGRGVQ